MSIPIIDQLRPLGNFPAVDASDVQAGNKRLSQVLSETPSTTYVDSVVDGKVDKVEGKGLSSNDYTNAEKNKLSGIEADANNYVHPTTAGNKHIPAGGEEGQILGWDSDGTAKWVDDHNTEYSDATTSTHGLMSTADKSKLDGIEAQANKTVVSISVPVTPTNATVPSMKLVDDTYAKNSNLTALTSRVSDTEDNIATQTARIDEIASLPSGSTSGDAELMDIRVKSDGTTASTAGNAVREQFNAAEAATAAVDAKMTIGENLFNKAITEDGYFYNYQSAAHKENENYCNERIDIGANIAFSVNGICHICYFSSSTGFLSGNVNGTPEHTSFTTPAGTEYMYVSPQIAAKDTFMVHYGATEKAYVPFYNKFTYDYIDKKPYEVGDIHFTVPVCQYTFRNSQRADNVTDNYVPATLIDVNAVVKLPLTYNQKGKKCPFIIIAHGAGYGVTPTTWGESGNANETSNFRDMIDYFVNSGYAVADINGYNNDFPNLTWGCPRTVQAYRKLYEYVTDNYNVDDHCFVYGFSMGGLVALNFALNNRDVVKCIGLGAPLTALYEQCWHSEYGAEKGWRQSSAIAYDFENTSEVNWQYSSAEPNASEQECWDENVEWTFGYDPRKRIMSINNKNVLLSSIPPTKIWLGTADAAIDVPNTELFVNAVVNSGQYAFLRLVSGGGHNISYGGNQYIVREIIYWFNRFIND